MTINLVAWSRNYVAVCCDRRVVLLQGSTVRVRNDDELKVVTFAPFCGGRFVVTFNGLAVADGLPMVQWLASTLYEIDCPGRSLTELYEALAEVASGNTAFASVDFVHSFVFAGWSGAHPIGAGCHLWCSRPD